MKKKVLSILLTLVMLLGVFAPVSILPASAAGPIEGATGSGTKNDPVIADDVIKLNKALEYDGPLYIVLTDVDITNITLSDPKPFARVKSTKVLEIRQNFEFKFIGSGKYSLFSVTDGADFTVINTDDSKGRKIEYNYTIFETEGPNSKLSVKGLFKFETTNKDKSDVYSNALVAHQGNIFIDGARFNSASFQNGAATLKDITVTDRASVKGVPFKLYSGTVATDSDRTYHIVPDYGTSVVTKDHLYARCVGGFDYQSPVVMPEGMTTAPETKYFLGLNAKFEFETSNNATWAEDEVYSPFGEIRLIDSSNNNLLYSSKDDDEGLFDTKVMLSVNLKDYIKKPGKYEVKEILTFKKDGELIQEVVHSFPINAVIFREFVAQSPAMPAGKISFNLGEITKASYPVTFYAHRLPQNMVDEGYESIAKLQVYTMENDTYVYGEKAYCDKGQKISYDLNNLPAGSYKLVETIELRDKNNKVVESAVNIFNIDWTPDRDISEVNISAKWQGYVSAPVCTTKGVKIVDYKWQRNARTGWTDVSTSTLFVKGYVYRLTVSLEAESGYELADSYTVKIDGEDATRGEGNTWVASRRIAEYINTVEVEGFCAPEAGAYPVFDGYDVQSANTSVKLVEWYKCDKDGKKSGEPLTAEDMFEKDSYYRLEVTVRLAKGYVLSDSTDFFIDGSSVNYYSLVRDSYVGYTGYKIYHVDDAEGKYELYLYDGNQTGAAKDIIIKDGQYIASDSATPVSTKPSGGYAYYKNGVLTFEAYINTKAHFVFEEGNLDVYLKGRNVIGAIYNSEHLGEISGLDARKGNMTIDAAEKGSLIIASNPLDAYCNIYVNTLTFNGGKVTSCLANGTYASALYTEKLIIADGYNAYVGETDDFDASEEWDSTTSIKDYDNVWLDEDVCRHNYVKYEKSEPTCIEEGCKETFEICEDCYLIVKKENGEILTGDEATEFFFDVVIPKGDHTYQFVEKHPATCTSAGAKSNYWHCIVCSGKFVTDAKTQITMKEFNKNIYLPKLDHQLTAVPAKAADCENNGNIAYWTCESCGKFFSDEAAAAEIGSADTVVPATGHTEEIIPGKAATETETGLTEGKKCSVCNKILVAQEEIPVIDAGHTHTYTDVVTAPTCKDKGFTTHTCACGDVIVDTYTDPTDAHTPVVVPGKAPTYQETGLTDGEKCSVCGKILKEQEVIDKLPTDHSHEYTDTVVAPTCGDKGYTKHVCICGDTIIDTYVDPTGEHTPEVIPGKPATETETGLTDGEKCSVCGKILKEQEEIPVLGDEPEILLGDVNKDGKITAMDARLALRISAKIDTPDEYQKIAADYNKDTKITAMDARLILRKSAKID